MSVINRRPVYSLTSGTELLPEMEEEMIYPSMDIPYDMEGFQELSEDDGYTDDQKPDGGRMERTGDDFNKTKMVPFMIATDGNTATQVAMLLEMIRYCMENSRDVLDTATGESKTYDIHLKVRNRGKSPFVVSIGDEPMPPLPLPEEPFLVGN